MRSLVIVMLILGAGLGLIGRALYQVRADAKRQFELIGRLEKQGAVIAYGERSELSWLESIVNRWDNDTKFFTVEAVTLKQGQYAQEDLTCIGELTGLQTYFDDQGHTNSQVLKSLAQSPTLKTLHVHRWSNAEGGAAAIFSGAPALEDLVIGGDAVDDEFLIAAGRHAKLNYLYLNANKVSSQGVKGLANSTSLAWLHLSSCNGLHEGLTELAQLSNLQQLVIEQETFSEADLQALGDFQFLQSLTIAATEFPPNVTNPISQLPALKSLFIAGKLSPYESFDKLAESGVVKLTLTGPITDEENFFDQIAKCKQLRTLNIRLLTQTDDRMASLAKLNQLRYLVITWQGNFDSVRRLHDRIPHCTITVYSPDGKSRQVFRSITNEQMKRSLGRQ
jgi:hypothetical protein